VVSIPSRFRGRARRDAAAFYLSELARGLLAGELGIRVGHETVRLRPADFLVLDILVSRKGRANRVAVRLRWLHPRVPSPSGQIPRRGRARLVRSRAESHLEFTGPSFERNPGTRDSHLDAHIG
jgi:amphi-Trp domain-containing protein